MPDAAADNVDLMSDCLSSILHTHCNLRNNKTDRNWFSPQTAQAHPIPQAARDNRLYRLKPGANWHHKSAVQVVAHLSRAYTHTHVFEWSHMGRNRDDFVTTVRKNVTHETLYIYDNTKCKQFAADERKYRRSYRPKWGFKNSLVLHHKWDVNKSGCL